MKIYLLTLSITLALFASTGCDKIKAFISPDKAPEEHSAPVVVGPELQILGFTIEEQVILSDFLEIRGLMRQANDYVVMINTQLVHKGEVLTLSVDKESYSVEVESIDEMRVILKASHDDE